MANDIFLHENIYRGKSVKDLFGAKHLTVCGAGAIGSNLVDNLARQGFSRLRVIDKDRIELHNINNQCYARKDVGALKVAALKTIVFNAVGVEIETENKELTGANVKKLLRGTDLIIDCFDNSSSRQILYDFSRLSGTPCIHSGVFEGFGEVSWNERYMVPQDTTEGNSCQIGLARNIFLLVVASATEEIIRFCLNPLDFRQRKLYISLGDLSIRKM